MADPEPEVAPEPEVNTPRPIAWEVWTYLERHRKDTLHRVGSFDAEWKADRFVIEAERNKPDPNLRVHYEVKAVFDSSVDPSVDRSVDSGDGAIDAELCD